MLISFKEKVDISHEVVKIRAIDSKEPEKNRKREFFFPSSKNFFVAIREKKILKKITLFMLRKNEFSLSMTVMISLASTQLNSR